MSYQKKTWVTKEIIKGVDLNHIEDGIADLSDQIGQGETDISKAYKTTDAVSSAIRDDDYIPIYTSSSSKRKTLFSTIKAAVLSVIPDWAKQPNKPTYTANEMNAVSTLPNQGLNNDQKTNARNNIGAGTSSFSGSYDDLTDLPIIGNGSLTIKRNGTTIKAFGANQTTDAEANILVPTATSELANDSGFITASSLPTVNNSTITIQKNGSNVDSFTINQSSNQSINISLTKTDVGLANVGNYKAVSTEANQGLTSTEQSNARTNIGAGTSNFSGNYNDLTNKPTIPTVNNATLTIQKNGTNVNTFTANASSNVTANITVPTKVSELTNDSGYITNAGVTGVKGDSESSYRTGQVNITASNIGLGNVGNFKAVSTVASQGLTDTEKSNARANIGAGTSSLTLGTSSSTAFRGDYGNSAYAHAVTNKGAAFASGLYKITTNAEGHVTAATAVAKADITGLGIPAQDTTYSAMTDSEIQAGTSTTARLITPAKFRANIDNKTWMGTCATAAATAAKVVSVDTGFLLVKGARIGIKFTNSNSAEDVTLNVNSTGAKSIYYNNTVYTGTSTTVCGYANRYTFYVYDGTNWIWDSQGTDSNTTYSAMSSSELTTGTATTSRVVRADYLKTGIDSLITAKGYTTNTGTVTKVSTGAGLTGGDVTTTGTIKANLASETKSTLASASITTTSSRQYAVNLDSNSKLSVNVPWTDTNTKVTSVGNHYAPSADSSAALSADASSSTSATWGSTDLVTGVNLQRDAKGHVTGITVDSIQMPANPNTDTLYPDAVKSISRGSGNDILTYTCTQYDDSTFTFKGCTWAGYCWTAAGDADKVCVHTSYQLTSKSYTYITIVNTNTAASALTLSINGKTAKPIYINGAASSETNYSLTRGTYLVYYNGTNYYFRTDGILTASITGKVNGHTVSANVPSDAVFTDTRDFKLGTTRAAATDNTLYFVYTT